jgi:hypothetical protein
VDADMFEDSKSGAVAPATAGGSAARRGSGGAANMAPIAEELGVSFGVEIEDDEVGGTAMAPIVKSWL